MHLLGPADLHPSLSEMAPPVDDVADEYLSGADFDHRDSVAPGHVPPSTRPPRVLERIRVCATVQPEVGNVAERESFDEFFNAVTGGTWADPVDPHRRVADALRRLAHRSVVYEADRDVDHWTTLAERLEALLEGADPDVTASRYDPADFYQVVTDRVRPNSRGTHPIMGVANAISPPLLVGYDDDSVYADVVYDARHEGLFGFVQGGFIAAAFDLMLGQAVARVGGRGVTASLTVSYRVPTPIGQPLQYRAQVERLDGRKAYSRAQLIRRADGVVTAEAEGLFVAPRQPLYEDN